MKKIAMIALSVFALASLPNYVTAEETTTPVAQTEEPAAAPVQQNKSQEQTKRPEKSGEVKAQKSKPAGKNELPTKKTNSEVGGRGIKLPTESGAPNDKTKAHDQCTCDRSDTTLPYCGPDAC